MSRCSNATWRSRVAPKAGLSLSLTAPPKPGHIGPTRHPSARTHTQRQTHPADHPNACMVGHPEQGELSPSAPTGPAVATATSKK